MFIYGNRYTLLEIFELYSSTVVLVVSEPLNTPLTPDRRQVERPPPLLQITSIFLVFYGLSHGTTLKKKGVAVF